MSIDIDPIETQEWLASLHAVMAVAGPERAQFLLKTLDNQARALGCTTTSATLETPYVNTIPVAQEMRCPGDPVMENRIEALVRWNAAAMVIRAQEDGLELGGHIGTFASSATLYEVGFNHFWRAPSEKHGGDLLYIQGHTAPGIYARSFLEGRLTSEQIGQFRREVGGMGLSSYPHPWLMPDYWQFPTVSMGLGPLQAIYQARFMKYRQARGFEPVNDRKVWCFCGDGEMDEPESLGAIGLAVREKLDNLIFVINCNLQRLDGPVRGNSKIIQELERVFAGVGWRVLKVLWGQDWDPLLAADHDGQLRARMQETVDGEYQNCKAKGGAYTRAHFFEKSPSLGDRIAHLSDDEITALKRGGHDPQKVYAAYAAAMQTTGQPTVILVKTVKGYGLGAAGEAQNTAHNTKKLGQEALKLFRDRFAIPISDADLATAAFYRPSEDSAEMRYLMAKRAALGGALPQRRRQASTSITVPPLERFQTLLESAGERSFSTTTAFVRILGILVKDKDIGAAIVPIVPDESRTFGMEGLFRQLGIYAPGGQKYEPVDKDQVMFYKESANGQILQEGINEAGAFCSWIAAGTSYAHHDQILIPFYIYYSMFGFQRIGDLAWAAADSRTKGFLIGGTSGRTTLNGEGLQHQDGHSHTMAGLIPNCISYDPTFAYELAVIVHHGLDYMYVQNKDAYFYITTLNENYTHPAMPSGPAITEGIIRGLYPLPGLQGDAVIQLVGAGAILREVIAAQTMLAEDFQVIAQVWSATSFNNLMRDGQSVARWNLRHPMEPPKTSYLDSCFDGAVGPIVAATDYIKSYTEQIGPYLKAPYYVLGTDGFGRSDARSALRAHFEVDRFHIAYLAVHALVESGRLPVSARMEAYTRYQIDPNKPDPMTV